MGRQRPRWEEDDDDDIREEFDFVDDDDDDDDDIDDELVVDDDDEDDEAEEESPKPSGRRAVNGDAGAGKSKPSSRRSRSGGRGRGGRGRGKEAPASSPKEEEDVADAAPSETRGGTRGPEQNADSRPANDELAEADQDRPTEPEVEEEPEIDESLLPPDNQDAVRALRDLGARVDMNEKGRVWRIFLYEKNKDNALAQIHGFPLLKEVWLLGSRVSKEMVAKLREVHPNTKIYI